MADLGNFDAAQYPESTYSPVPEGRYPAEIIDSEWVDASNGNGKYLKLKFSIIGGTYGGRYVWERLHLQNNNLQAVEISKRKLADICRAVKVLNPIDSVQLHNKPLEIKVIVREAKGNYDASNDVGGHYPLGATTQADKPQQVDSNFPF